MFRAGREGCGLHRVAIVMGSDSDLPAVKKAAECLESFGVGYEMRILSAHRTPAQTAGFAQNARKNGFEAVIAVAGKAAHLAGIIAAYTTLPVIAVPLKSSALEGLDALLSSVQMPSGVPVATVAIDGTVNAALLAVRILSVSDSSLAAKLEEYRSGMEKSVLEKDRALTL